MATSTPNQTGSRTPKVMSNRLLTMKFMQRAATSPTSSAPSTPGSAQDSAPPSSKRTKLSHPSSQEPSPIRSGNVVDVRAAALNAEATRQAALERSWNGEETKWSFAIQPDHQATGGEGFRAKPITGRRPERDESAEGTVTPPALSTEQGRRVFGSKSKYASAKGKQASEEEDASSGGSGDSDDSEDSLDQQARDILDQPERDLPDRSIGRGIGLSGRGRAPDISRIQCHNCQNYGHKAKDCPQRSARSKKNERPSKRQSY